VLRAPRSSQRPSRVCRRASHDAAVMARPATWTGSRSTVMPYSSRKAAATGYRARPRRGQRRNAAPPTRAPACGSGRSGPRCRSGCRAVSGRRRGLGGHAHRVTVRSTSGRGRQLTAIRQPSSGRGVVAAMMSGVDTAHRHPGCRRAGLFAASPLAKLTAMLHAWPDRASPAPDRVGRQRARRLAPELAERIQEAEFSGSSARIPAPRAVPRRR